MNNNEQNLPQSIGKPALRALQAEGITTLQQTAKLSDEELTALHGVGPKAVRILRDLIASNQIL